MSSLGAPSVITKCCGQTILTWRQIAKDKTAYCKKNLSNKNCRDAEEKNRPKPEKGGHAEKETRTGHKENGNETGSLIASSDPSMLTSRLSP